ncbi:MAG: MlaD family protein [Gemmatimonadota bacterium]
MSRKNEIVTGSFVLLGIVVLVGGAMWLSGARLGGSERLLTARFQSVGLIKAGSAVTLRGVRVGRVSRVSLEDASGVDIELRVRGEVALPEDPIVILQPVSLFGEWQAVIVPIAERTDVDPDTIRLPSGRLPGITMAAFSELSESSEMIAENLRSLTERFEVAFNESTARDLAQSITNFSQASDELVALLERQRAEFGDFTRDLAEAGEVVREAATDLNETVSRLASATEEGELEAIFDNTRDASQSLRSVAADLRGTVADLDRSIARADSAAREAQRLLGSINEGEGSLGQLAHNVELYENTAAALAELRALLDDLKRNPRKYFNFSVF